MRFVAPILALGLLVGCGVQSMSAQTVTTYPAHCVVRAGGDLPDFHCTPGALNPAVRQSTISTTICKAGWTKTVRPSVSVTNRIKRQAVVAYGHYAGTSRDELSLYELDHLVPLELGGSPSDVRNLWPERGAHNRKDAVENKLRRLVCSGRMSLSKAQRIMRTDWREAA